MNENTRVFTNHSAKERPKTLVNNNIIFFNFNKNHQLINISNSGKSPKKTTALAYGESTSSCPHLQKSRPEMQQKLAMPIKERQNIFTIPHDDLSKGQCPNHSAITNPKTAKQKAPSSTAQADFAPLKRRRIYNKNIERLCVEKVLDENQSVRTVAQSYDVPMWKIYHWLSKIPLWKGLHDDADKISEKFHQKVVEANRGLLPAQRVQNVAVDSPAKALRDVQAESLRDRIAEHIHHQPAQPVLHNRPAAEGIVQRQPFWRPW